MSKPTRRRFTVVCVDDDDFARGALKYMLADPEIEVLALCASEQECLPVVAQHKPQIALIDMQLDGDPMGGVGVIKRIRELSPATICAVLTATADNGEYFFQALQVGAEAYYSKSYAVGTSLPALVKSLARREYQLEPRFAKQLAEYVKGKIPLLEVTARSHVHELSERERQVLELIAEGYGPSDIAKELVISPNTVKTHKKNMVFKLRLDSQAQLVVYAVLERYLVQPLRERNK
jgi:DNA-binding NarL/FixJ family response regulator